MPLRLAAGIADAVGTGDLADMFAGPLEVAGDVDLPDAGIQGRDDGLGLGVGGAPTLVGELSKRPPRLCSGIVHDASMPYTLAGSVGQTP